MTGKYHRGFIAARTSPLRGMFPIRLCFANSCSSSGIPSGTAFDALAALFSGGRCAAQKFARAQEPCCQAGVRPPVGGMLSDLSATGARVAVTASDRLPLKFNLLSPTARAG
jgi:hypothetical protein